MIEPVWRVKTRLQAAIVVVRVRMHAAVRGHRVSPFPAPSHRTAASSTQGKHPHAPHRRPAASGRAGARRLRPL